MRSFRQTPVSGDPRVAFAPIPSDSVQAILLTAGAAKKVTVPSGAKYVSMAGTKDFRAKFGDTSVVATVPSVDVTNGSASVLNPAVRSLGNMGFISLISAEACEVTLEFWG